MSSKDVADWDAIENKDDPASLQKYVETHPDGRFSSLARLKLKRMGLGEGGEEAPQPKSAAPAQPRPAKAAPPAQRGSEQKEQKQSALVPVMLALVLIAAAGGAGGYMWWRQDQQTRAEAALLSVWQNTPRDDADALRAFIADHPGPYQSVAQGALEALERERFEAAIAQDSIDVLETFLADFPESEGAPRVRDRIGELRRVAARETALRTAAAPNGIWRGQLTGRGQRFQLVAQFGRDHKGRLVANIRYIEPGCTGVWVGAPGSSAGRGPWQVQEVLNRNFTSCGGRGVVSLTPLPGGDLFMEYRNAQSGPAAISGVLRKDDTL